MTILRPRVGAYGLSRPQEALRTPLEHSFGQMGQNPWGLRLALSPTYRPTITIDSVCEQKGESFLSSSTLSMKCLPYEDPSYFFWSLSNKKIFFSGKLVVRYDSITTVLTF